VGIVTGLCVISLKFYVIVIIIIIIIILFAENLYTDTTNAVACSGQTRLKNSHMITHYEGLRSKTSAE